MDFFISTAQAAEGTEGGAMSSIIMLVGFVVIFYFMLIRPQQKRAKEHKNLVSGLNKNDEIAMAGGILGSITKVTDDYLVVAIAENTEIKVQKASVVSVLPKGTLKAIAAE